MSSQVLTPELRNTAAAKRTACTLAAVRAAFERCSTMMTACLCQYESASMHESDNASWSPRTLCDARGLAVRACLEADASGSCLTAPWAQGVPFRETHHLSGEAVKMAEDRGCQLSDLSADDLRTIHPDFGDDVTDVWNFETSAELRNTEGGASKSSVLQQVEKLRTYMKEEAL